MEIIKYLAMAYAGECQARNRYTFYSKIAIGEGYQQIGDLFLKTAEQELQHAKWMFKMINGLKKPDETYLELSEEVGIPTTFGTTVENLTASIHGEHFENSELYPKIAKIADEEGYPEIADRMRAIIIAEKHHEELYRKLLNLINNAQVFKRDEKTVWVCKKCGYVHEGLTPPEECPSCDHPYEYFSKLCEDF
ncbi:rubrerythrin [Methanococcus voltae]|uniref:rubrerythrin n=1 Tax=Methanococcus voltae TaxID=2188 RepID=UPI001AE4007F|nr:rubrerythrin family protein [Methanococcus voltae]MBP2144043.1 rubrerythrin [Methanococcus voltae]